MKITNKMYTLGLFLVTALAIGGCCKDGKCEKNNKSEMKHEKNHKNHNKSEQKHHKHDKNCRGGKCGSENMKHDKNLFKDEK